MSPRTHRWRLSHGSVSPCSGGKEREGDLQYYPFRMTPYLMKVQDAELSEEQFCCLLLAERVHSGYEGEPLSNTSGFLFVKVTTEGPTAERATWRRGDAG